MTVRVFDGVDDILTLDEGTLDTVLSGAWTAAVLFKRSGNTNDGTQILVSLNSGGSQRFGISISTGLALQVSVGGITRTFGFTISNATWYLFVVKKAAGDGQTPRANLWSYTSDTWAGWANGSGTFDNDGNTLDGVQLGNGPGNFPLNGKLGAAVIYSTALSDSSAETLEDAAQNWFDLSPAAMWRLNQSSTATAVEDDTAGNADQTSLTGTTVDTGDDPDPWSFALGGAALTWVPQVIRQPPGPAARPARQSRFVAVLPVGQAPPPRGRSRRPSALTVRLRSRTAAAPTAAAQAAPPQATVHHRPAVLVVRHARPIQPVPAQQAPAPPPAFVPRPARQSCRRVLALRRGGTAEPVWPQQTPPANPAWVRTPTRPRVRLAAVVSARTVGGPVGHHLIPVAPLHRIGSARAWTLAAGTRGRHLQPVPASDAVAPPATGSMAPVARTGPQAAPVARAAASASPVTRAVATMTGGS